MSEKYDYVRFAKTLKEMLENNDNDFLEMKIAREAAKELYESLKTPTAEKVCKELGETLKIELEYVYEKLPSIVWDDQSLIWIIEILQKEFKKDFEEQTEQGEKNE